MLFVGQATLRGDLARYAQSFNLLELAAEPGRLPRTGTLAKWPGVVGESFVFSLRLPASLWRLDSAQASRFTEYAIGVAGVLGVRFIVIQTPATATPTTRTREKLAALLAVLRPAGAALAWEPHGVWENQESVEWAAELDAVLVRDLSRDEAPPGQTVYTRLLALGEGRSVRAGAVQRVSERVRDAGRAYVVLEGSGARRAVQLFRQELSE